LISIFLRGKNGTRPVNGSNLDFATDPHWHDLVLFYEYFDGEDGSGLGASHQTGWTGLVAKLIQQTAARKSERSGRLHRGLTRQETYRDDQRRHQGQ
jgi:hypothetical protein